MLNFQRELNVLDCILASIIFILSVMSMKITLLIVTHFCEKKNSSNTNWGEEGGIHLLKIMEWKEAC